MNARDKMELVDHVFEAVRSKSDPILFAGVEGKITLAVADRQYFIHIQDGTLGLASEPPRNDLLASVELSIDEFLVRTCVCAGYTTDERHNEAPAISGDATVANAILSVLGILPDRIAQGLLHLERYAYEMRYVDELLAPSLEHIKQKRPFVVRGGAKAWPAAHWTLDGLACALSEGELRQRVREIASSPSSARYFSARIDAVVVPDLQFEVVGAFRFEPGETFLSTSGALAMLHRDFVDGVAAVFLGARRFTFFPPSDARYLYPLPGKDWDAQTCHVRDPRDFDPLAFPLAEHASPIHVVVKPTDLVYIPAGWFHSVVSLNTSILIKASADLELSWPSLIGAMV